MTYHSLTRLHITAFFLAYLGVVGLMMMASGGANTNPETLRLIRFGCTVLLIAGAIGLTITMPLMKRAAKRHDQGL